MKKLSTSLVFSSLLSSGHARAVSAACPTATDTGIAYHFAMPSGFADGNQTGTIVVMADANGSIQIDDPCGSSNYNVTATAPAVHAVCNGAEFTGTGPAQDYEIGVARTDAAVSVLHVVFKYEYPSHLSDDAFLVLPKVPDRRGNDYWTMGHRGPTGQSSRWLATTIGTPTLTYKDCGDSTQIQALASGDVFQQLCGPSTTRKDGLGYRVHSSGGDKFSFISGATCAVVPVGSLYCDVLAEMMPPASWWGTEFLITEFNTAVASVGDLVRLMATASNTTVTLAAAGSGNITASNASGQACTSTSSFSFTNAGDWCDVNVEGGARITGSTALVVGHFMKGDSETNVGDPSFTIALPSSRFRCGSRFFSFGGFDQDGLGQGSYVNIVAPSGSLASVQLDGDDLSDNTTCGGYSKVDFGASGWSWTKCLLADPAAGGTQHVLDSGTTAIAAYVYGQTVNGSYSYLSGMSF